MAWDRQNARAYDPRWIALTGAEAFSNYFVALAPEHEWPVIDEETRQEAWRENQALLRAAELSSKNADRQLNEDEMEAFEDNLMELSGVNSNALGKLNEKDFAGAIRILDEAIQLDSVNTWAYYNRGKAKSEL